MSDEPELPVVVESGLRRRLLDRRQLGHYLAGIAWVFVLVALLVGAVSALATQNLVSTAFTVPILALFVVGSWYASLPTRLTIGRDGVAMTEGGRTRFVCWADVDADKPLSEFAGAPNLLLLNRTGGREQVPLHTGDSADEVRDAVAAGLAAFASRARGELPDPLAEGSDVARWSERLAQAAQGSGTAYRSAPVTPDQLVRVVEDPAFDPRARVAAALAAARTGTEEHRVRVRVAAAGSANEGTRRALSAAAEQELDERATSRAESLHRKR